jgi:pantoate--beta-alanine ligase
LTVLFNTIRPDFAFFGQKDAQQTLVVKRLARDLAFDIEVVVLPTVREQTGLALSSRNAYLTDEQRRAAAALYRSLAQAREVYLEGERNPRRLAEVVRSQLEAEPLARLEYVGVVDAETMDKFDRIPEDRSVLIALAAKVGATRLIDNIVIQPARQKARTTSEG